MNKKRIYIYSSIGAIALILVSVLVFGVIQASGQTITIKDILMKDSIKNGEAHKEPKTYQEVFDLIENDPPERTGWSAILYACEPAGDGTNEWAEKRRSNTADASYSHAYSVENYRDEIIEKYDQETYDLAVASGQQLKYDGKGMWSINGTPTDTRTWPCKTGDKAFFYNNNDFKLTLTFTPEEPEPDPEEPTPEPEPEPEEPPKYNEPPVAVIDAPDEVEIGEKFCVRSKSYDTDGVIVVNDWSYYGEYGNSDDEGFTETTTSKCGLYFEDEGEEQVWLQVTDDGGKSDDTTHTINVIYPTPDADFEVGGTLKENRAMWIDPEHPYGGNTEAEKIAPITEDVWTINGKDNNHTAVLYRLTREGAFSDLRVHVYFDDNNNGTADAEGDTGFIYSSKEHGVNGVLEATYGDDLNVNFGYNDSGINDPLLYGNVGIKLNTPEKTFVLATPIYLEIVDVYSSIDNGVYNVALILKRK